MSFPLVSHFYLPNPTDSFYRTKYLPFSLYKASLTSVLLLQQPISVGKTHLRHQDILPPITLRTPRAIVYNYFLRMLDPLLGSMSIICSFGNGQGRPQTSLRCMFRQMSFELLQGYGIFFYHQLKSDAVVQRGDRAPVPIFASSVAALFYVCTLELFSCFDCTLP
jgi:hypothetical protein